MEETKTYSTRHISKAESYMKSTGLNVIFDMGHEKVEVSSAGELEDLLTNMPVQLGSCVTVTNSGDTGKVKAMSMDDKAYVVFGHEPDMNEHGTEMKIEELEVGWV